MRFFFGNSFQFSHGLYPLWLHSSDSLTPGLYISSVNDWVRLRCWSRVVEVNLIAHFAHRQCLSVLVWERQPELKKASNSPCSPFIRPVKLLHANLGKSVFLTHYTSYVETGKTLFHDFLSLEPMKENQDHILMIYFIFLLHCGITKSLKPQHLV